VKQDDVVRTTRARRGRHSRRNASTDMGVKYARRGKGQSTRDLLRVKSNPARGQYVFDQKTGTYTFSRSDIGRQLIISSAVSTS